MNKEYKLYDETNKRFVTVDEFCKITGCPLLANATDLPHSHIVYLNAVDAHCAADEMDEQTNCTIKVVEG